MNEKLTTEQRVMILDELSNNYAWTTHLDDVTEKEVVYLEDFERILTATEPEDDFEANREALNELVDELNTAEDEAVFIIKKHKGDELYSFDLKDGVRILKIYENQIALRKFPVLLDALLEYRNPKTLSQYRELPELVDDKFNKWCLDYLRQEDK